MWLPSNAYPTSPLFFSLKTKQNSELRNTRGKALSEVLADHDVDTTDSIGFLSRAGYDLESDFSFLLPTATFQNDTGTIHPDFCTENIDAITIGDSEGLLGFAFYN